MAQLEFDAGGLGPWIAAEHRNTMHPHVHIVLAAKREVAPGRYRSVLVTRERLGRMKLALAHDNSRQREGRPLDREWSPPRLRSWSRRHDSARPRSILAGLTWDLPAGFRVAIRRAARRYELDAERDRRQRERDGGWER